MWEFRIFHRFVPSQVPFANNPSEYKQYYFCIMAVLGLGGFPLSLCAFYQAYMDHCDGSQHPLYLQDILSDGDKLDAENAQRSKRGLWVRCGCRRGYGWASRRKTFVRIFYRNNVPVDEVEISTTALKRENSAIMLKVKSVDDIPQEEKVPLLLGAVHPEDGDASSASSATGEPISSVSSGAGRRANTPEPASSTARSTEDTGSSAGVGRILVEISNIKEQRTRRQAERKGERMSICRSVSDGGNGGINRFSRATA